MQARRVGKRGAEPASAAKVVIEVGKKAGAARMVARRHPGKSLLLKRRKVKMAGTTGFEPATSDVTGRRSNQLNYVPAMSR